MATKTLGTGGDYATFTAAIAGIATWDTLNVLTAGTYTEAAELPAISKTVEFVNLSGGQVIVRAPVGKHIGSVTGGTEGTPVVVTWTGDFDFQIRKPGVGGTEYHWHIAGTASADNRMIFHGCTFTSDYTTGNTQVVYQQPGKSHEFVDCTVVGQYDCLVTVGGKCNTSIIDGLTITGSTKYIVHGYASTDLFGSFDHRRIAGNVTLAPYINGNQASGVSVTTSGLLTTSQMWGMDGATTAKFGTGTIAVEKCVFSGSREYGFAVLGAASTGTTFRDCEFGGFSGEAVNVILSPLTNLVDYCGAGNGCTSLSNSAGSVGAHCQISDPLFVDYAAHDYHLQAGSPRIDAGTACIATVDPDGNAIPLGAGVDIGAYEWVPSIAPVVYEAEPATEDTVIATDLDGTPLPGFDAYDLLPTPDQPLVLLVQLIASALFSDRRASLDDILPGGQTDRRGWVGDTATRKKGSLLWLLAGQSVDGDTAAKAKQYIEGALKQLITDQVMTSVTVDTALIHIADSRYRLSATIEARLVTGQGVRVRFPDLWGL